MNVCIQWWNTIKGPGGSDQAILGNVQGFREAGHEVDLYLISSNTTQPIPVEEYDVVISPFIYKQDYPDLSVYDDTHLHVQIGGYGNIVNRTEDDFRPVMEQADTVSALSTNVAGFFSDLYPDQEYYIIPNAPHFELFSQQPFTESEGMAFCPKANVPHKPIDRVIETASKSNTIINCIILGECDFNTPGNLHLYPPVMLTQMESWYRDCSVVLNCAKRESFSTTALEAFMTGRPYLSTVDGLAPMLTVPELDSDMFGSPYREFDEYYQEEFFTGDHVAYVQSSNRLGFTLDDLVFDPERCEQMGQRAREWIERSFGDWGWEMKAETIMDVITNV